MKPTRIISLVLILAICFTLLPTDAQALTTYDTIRVKLSTNNATSIPMAVTGSYFVKESSAIFSGGTLSLTSNHDGTLTATHSSLGVLHVGSSVSIMRTDMAASAGHMRFNSRNYLGHFSITLTSSDYLQVVNTVPLAHYLYGVVGHEMNNSFPIDALRAQAIAAKGYAFSRVKLAGNSAYDIGDTSSDQVYRGYTAANTNVIAAVDSTINEVLTYRGEVLCTYYAASNGGETNLVTYAWTGGNATNDGYAIAPDPFDLQNSMSPIETALIPVNIGGTITRALFDMILSKVYYTYGYMPVGIDTIRAFEMHTPKYSGTTRNLSKMSMLVDFVLADNTIERNVALDFSTSELLTYGVFADASLRIYWGEMGADGYYRIYHARWGHGVGLSQRGAQERANAGYNYKDILNFYYPGATLSTFNVSVPPNPTMPNSTPTNPQPEATPMPTNNASTDIVAYGHVTASKLNLRKGPDENYASYGMLYKDTSLSILEVGNSWHHVLASGVEGYVFAQYVKIDTHVHAQASPSPTPTPDTSGVVVGSPSVIGYGSVTSNGVNFRLGPGVNYESFLKLSKGTVLELYEKTGSWYYANTNGKYGYISASYFKSIAQPTPSPTPTPTPSVVESPSIIGYGSVTSDGVNFRLGPGVNYESFLKLSKGTELELFEKTGSWYYAGANGKLGYISVSYVKSIARPTPSPTPAQKISTGIITGTNVNFRQGPDTTHASLRRLEKNAGLYLVGQSGAWWYAIHSGQYGYVHGDYVKITGEAWLNSDGSVSIGTDNTAKTNGSGTTSGSVNLRKGPSTAYASLGILAKGTALTLHLLSDGWYKVTTADGKEGYVSGKYVSVALAPPTSSGSGEGNVKSDDELGFGETISEVNFRTGPSTSSKIITKLKVGVGVTIYSQNDGWYEVDYQGTRGYLFAKYVKRVSVQGNSVTPQTPDVISGASLVFAVGTTTGTLNMRTKATTSNSTVLLQLGSGVRFNILAQSGDWYYILFGGKTGYVNKPHVKLVENGTADIPNISSNAGTIITSTIASVNLRTGCSIDAPIIRLLPNKTALEVYFTTEAGWCLVKAGNDYGYITSEYAKLSR